MKSENLSLKNIINELVFSKENSYYSMKRLKKKEEKRFIVACKEINRKTT